MLFLNYDKCAITVQFRKLPVFCKISNKSMQFAITYDLKLIYINLVCISISPPSPPT